MPHPAPASTRAGLIWRIVIPVLLGAGGLFASSHADTGSWQFYLATFFTAAIRLGTWLKWGDRRCFSGAAPRELARGAGIGIALIILFLLGALIVCSIPALAGPVSDLLDNMRHGSVPMTLATLIINGVGEELFFRDVARRALSDASSPTPSLIAQVALYIAVTAAMGVPLLLVDSALISATTLHLVWSTGMAFVLPGLIH
ncbi:type II CAAX prenyl endopeptidase Rce1 family protein [Corynebacterium singulare]|uniref:CPBP family intramembrane metalloprotease n=1 Tax=Corynebacterium singulare TaxID=161899 RepID=A0ABS9PSS9_9CORY|nr:CPBP family intramembrane metalloprotease [Corynebacterium singulare]